MSKKITSICWLLSTIVSTVFFTLILSSIVFTISSQTVQIVLFISIFTMLVSLITIESIAAIYKCVK